MDYLKVILEFVLPLVVAIATPILVLLARRFVAYLEKKWNFEATQEQLATLDRIVTDAIGFAEEQALKKLKLGEDSPDGAKKLDMALDYIADRARDSGLDELAKEKLVRLIEAKLFARRASGGPSATTIAAAYKERNDTVA